jgi:hypothetical protein
MSTFQLSFKTTLGFVSIIEKDGYITDINFRKVIKQKTSSQLLKARDQIKKFLNKKIKKIYLQNKSYWIEGSITSLESNKKNKLWKDCLL